MRYRQFDILDLTPLSYLSRSAVSRNSIYRFRKAKLPNMNSENIMSHGDTSIPVAAPPLTIRNVNNPASNNTSTRAIRFNQNEYSTFATM